MYSSGETSSFFAREYRQSAEEPSLAGFLQDISLVSDQDTIRDERGLVTLMTLHNAKGLEFRACLLYTSDAADEL